MRDLIFAILIVSLSVPALAARLDATLTPSQAQIGDELVLTLKVDGASATTIRFPSIGQSDFTVLKIDSSDLASGSSLRYTLAVYDTGQYVLDELPVVVGAETLYTPQLGVAIQSVLPDTASAVLPLKPYREHPFRLKDLLRELVRSPWTWIVVGLLAALAGFWAWRKYFRKPAAGEMAVPEVVLPPDEQAVRNLIALKDKKYPARGLLKEFFSEYSQIMRMYLERRYEFPALEMTTFDLEQELQAEVFPKLLERTLLPTFHEADLVKFAKYVPPLERCEAMLETGFDIVAKTKQAETAETESKAA